METKKATVYDIAKKLKCSPATVSLALNDDNRVAQKTKDAVQEVARELNYKPSYFGKSLITGKSKMIKVVLPDLHNPVFVNIADGIESYIKKTDYHIILDVTYNSKQKEIDSFSSFSDGMVDGIIISPIFEEDVTAWLLENNFNLKKVVYVGIKCPVPDKIHYCAADSKQGAYIGVENMLKNGCKRIAFFAPTVAEFQGSKRFSGYLEALEKYNIPFEKELYVNCSQEFQEIYRRAYKLIKEQKPDGIFCLYDYAALPIIKAASALKLRVPEDLMITGYDNIEIGEFLDKPLTTVDPHQKEQGYKAAELMMNLLLEKECPTQNMITPTLVERESTCSRNSL